jgi:hypothetical protein
MNRCAFIFFFLAAVLVSSAGETNYFCVVCGKGPLAGRIWMSKWGPICNDCYKLEDRCSLCGLPVREGDGHVKTGDGRFICRFDKTNAVLNVDEARDIFDSARADLVSLFGSGFALKFTEVKVDLFDVDYWSEKGRDDGLHKYGFSSTRRNKVNAECTHEVVMLSGQLRDNLAATAAHEYTHLWINENKPADRVIDQDTIEAICETASYELMESRKLRGQQERIMENPYTHGAILQLLDVEKEHGFRYVLDWVKNGETLNFEATATAAVRVVPPRLPALTATNRPAPLPDSLKLGGLLLNGQENRAIIDNLSFAAGDTRKINLRNGAVDVHCREIHQDGVTLEVQGVSGPVTLKIGEERYVP